LFENKTLIVRIITKGSRKEVLQLLYCVCVLRGYIPFSLPYLLRILETQWEIL